MLESEYASVNNVRFPSADSVKMYDSDGNIVLCKCGKPAGMAIIGKEAFLGFCSDCSPVQKYSAEFIYKPPLK